MRWQSQEQDAFRAGRQYIAVNVRFFTKPTSKLKVSLMKSALRIASKLPESQANATTVAPPNVRDKKNASHAMLSKAAPNS
jgi:hypothetical protein